MTVSSLWESNKKYIKACILSTNAFLTSYLKAFLQLYYKLLHIWFVIIIIKSQPL